MALSRKKTSAQKPEVKEPVKKQTIKAVEKPAYKKTQQKYQKESKFDYLKNNFTPECIDWFKNTFGLDLKSSDVDLTTLKALKEGRITPNVEVKITPRIKDYALSAKQDKDVYMDGMPLSCVMSLRVMLRKEDGKLVEPDKRHPAFVQTFPIYGLTDTSKSFEKTTEKADKASKGEKESDALLTALSNVGMDKSFAYLSDEYKELCRQGEGLDVAGTVSVYDEASQKNIRVHIAGYALLSPTPEGYSVGFETNTVSDLTEGYKEGARMDLAARRIIDGGNIMLDFQAKGEDGKRIGEFSEQGKMLLEEGIALGAVVGYSKEEKHYYQVAAINNGIYCEEMDSQEIERTNRLGKTVKETHFTLHNPKTVEKDGVEKVWVDGQQLEPQTPQDLVDYKAGLGGLFKGFEEVDAKGRKTIKDVYAYADPRKGGFATVAEGGVMEAIKARREAHTAKVEEKQSLEAAKERARFRRFGSLMK